MRITIRLGKIFGIPVGINSSWFLVIVLITFLLHSQFSLEFPRWNAGQTWVLAGMTGLLFFGSVLAHELAHSVVATNRGIPVRGITLFVFGGAGREQVSGYIDTAGREVSGCDESVRTVITGAYQNQSWTASR